MRWQCTPGAARGGAQYSASLPRPLAANFSLTDSLFRRLSVAATLPLWLDKHKGSGLQTWLADVIEIPYPYTRAETCNDRRKAGGPEHAIPRHS